MNTALHLRYLLEFGGERLRTKDAPVFLLQTAMPFHDPFSSIFLMPVQVNKDGEDEIFFFMPKSALVRGL